MNKGLDSLVSVADFRELAKRRLPKAVFEFIDGGAEDEVTLNANLEAFNRRHIVPRILTDVSAPDVSISFLGAPLSTPLVICPMGSCGLVRPDADFAIASAAAARGIPYTLSTMSTAGMEEMARRSDGPLWFQLYVLKDRDFNESLIARAAEFGYAALVVTVDLQAGGKREKDLRNGISVPLRPTPRTVLDAALHPRWTYRQLSRGLPEFQNVRGYLNDTGAGLTIAARVGQNLDAGFDWNGLKRIRDLWKGQLFVKGMMHSDDAFAVAEMGADALWLSNHGGRQLDGAQASLDALEMIADRLDGRLPIILDSGVRRGRDVLKARALGATVSAVGRAALFGAVAGQDGVSRVLDILLDELALAMKLSGHPRLSDVKKSLLAPTAP